MRQHLERITIKTVPRALHNITHEVQAAALAARVQTGLVTLFVRHTTASLLIQDNADSDVRADIQESLDRLSTPVTPFRPNTEGEDVTPAHIKATLTPTSIGIPIIDRQLAIGGYQAIYLAEHRRAAQIRTLLAHVIGE